MKKPQTSKIVIFGDPHHQEVIAALRSSHVVWAIPEELGIPHDTLRARLDFYHQSTTLTLYEGDAVVTKPVDAMDVVHCLANELSFGSGLLPPNTLWWRNTKGGPVTAVYEPPRTRILALQRNDAGAPHRFKLPLPGFIFLCSPGEPPWVYAVKRKPTKESDYVYKAPLANVFANGRSCPGSHKYPNRVADIVESFFVSFFSSTADLHDRSKKFPENIIHQWEFIDKKKTYPMDDLVQMATIRDLLNMEMR